MSTSGRGIGLRRIAGPLTALRSTGQGAEFAAWILFARELGTSDFGQLSIVFLVSRYAGLVADWGASFRGPRDVAAGWNTTVRHLVRTRALLAVALTTLIVAGCSWCGVADLAPVAAVTLNLGFGRDWIALGRRLGGRAGIPSAAQGIVVLTGALLVTSPQTAAIAVGAAYAIGGLVSVGLNRLPPDGGVDPSRLNAWSLLAVVSNQISSTADVILLGLLGSLSDAGIYAAAYRIPNAWLALLGMVLAGLLPIVTRALHDDPEQYASLLRRALSRSAIAGAVVALSAIPLALSVPLIFGDAYAAGRGPMLVLVLATAMVTVASPLHAYVQAPGNDRRYAVILSAGAVLNLALNLILIPLAGMLGAAFATLSTQAMIAFLLWVAVRPDRLVHSPSTPPQDVAQGPGDDA